MLSAAITCFLIGATLIAVGCIMRDASRIPAIIRRLQAEGAILHTPYTGPTYTRHGREIVRSKEFTL